MSNDAAKTNEPDELADDPAYRAGLLMGRRQASTDVMGLLLDPMTSPAEQQVGAVFAWWVQAKKSARRNCRW